MRPRLFSRGALPLGAALTGLQIAIAVLLAPEPGLGQAYSRLCAWDCHWYESIVRNGYRSPVPPVRQDWNVSNVAFFPGYPVLGRALYLGTGIEPRTGLLIVAQGFAVVFWAALWTWLMRWRIRPAGAALVMLAVLAHPAAFFLVSGYSESLFLASLLLFLLPGARKAAFLAGFAATATRIVGLAAAAVPLMVQLCGLSRGRMRRRVRYLVRSAGLSAAAASGALLFLAYCQARFGEYDLYLETQRIGWGIVPDYGAIWKWPSFRYRFVIDGVATRATLVAFAWLAALEAVLATSGRGAGLKRRLPVYFSAFLIFFVTLSGLKSVGFISMIRYSLPWYVLLALCAAHLARRLPWLSRPAVAAGGLVAMLGWIAVLAWFQLAALREFMTGRWFA